MAKDRYQQLKPPQITAAVASFARRYRESLAPWLTPADAADDQDPLPAHTLERVNDTVRTLALCDRAVEMTLTHHNATVPAAVIDADLRDWPAAGPDDLTSLVEELDDLCHTLAQRLGSASADDWGRTATIAGSGTTVRTTEIAQEAVRTAAENLRHI